MGPYTRRAECDGDGGESIDGLYGALVVLLLQIGLQQDQRVDVAHGGGGEQ